MCVSTPKMIFMQVKDHVVCVRVFHSSGAVRKSRWPSWAPVPKKPTVSVDVKQHSIKSKSSMGLSL